MPKQLKKMIIPVIENATTVIMSYLDEEGFPISKALLAPRKVEGIETFWFSTNTSSNKVACFQANHKASLYFMDQKQFKGMSLVGTMAVLETKEAKAQLWLPGDECYYPQGVTDPDYCVLQFSAIKGRFYSEFSSQDVIFDK